MLCYPPCKEGYTGLSHLCWTVCPPGFANGGVFCDKPAGHWRRDRKSNECDPGFHENGNWGFATYCHADCPKTMTDVASTCTKQSYGRGAGVPLGCSNGLVQAGLFCYKECANGYEGSGDFCFSVCAPGFEFCGPALCVPSAEKNCSSKIANMVKSVVGMSKFGFSKLRFLLKQCKRILFFQSESAF